MLAAAAAVPPALSHRGLVLQYSTPVGLVGYVGREGHSSYSGDGSALPTKMAVLEELASRVTLVGYSQVDLSVPQRPALTPECSRRDLLTEAAAETAGTLDHEVTSELTWFNFA